MAQPFSTLHRRLRARSRQARVNMNTIIKEVATVADQAIVSQTPVKTGRARGNWDVGIGFPVTEADFNKFDPEGADTIARNTAKIATRQPGQDINLTNNIYYIVRLNRGRSPQAPPFYIQTAVQQAINHVRTFRIFDVNLTNRLSPTARP